MTIAGFEQYGARLPIEGDRCAGKVAVISGAGSAGALLGTGAASAILFAAQGAAVVLFDPDAARAENTRQLIEAISSKVAVVTGDVRLAADCDKAVQCAKDCFGTLDILVNNAGVARPGDALTVTDDDWDFMLDVNLKGAMILGRAAAHAMKDNGGSIINVSSLSALQAFGSVAYSASKGGLISMTRDMAFTLGPFGIRVNCLVPGFLATPMGGAGNSARRESRRHATLLHSEGTAWDLAWAALFLASDESRWITAASLNVDGGTSAASNLPAMRSADGQ